MVENKEGPLEALCILFSDTKGIQWAAANATHANGGIRKGPIRKLMFFHVNEEPL